MSIFREIAELECTSLNAALCTVVQVRGSTPRKAGAKMIVIDNKEPLGKIIGTIGGGAIEHFIREKALLSIFLESAQLISTSLRNELGMCCGGEMTVFIEPIIKKPTFICFGAGHIAQALCPLLAKMGYEINVVDSRKELLENDAFATAKHLFTDTSSFSFKDMPFSKSTFVLVATHDHSLDQDIIENLLKESFKYAALVGSKRKAIMTKKRLMAKGFSESDISRIVCPAGILIDAETPDEIAVSIAAQMTSVKNEKKSQNQSDDRSGW